MFVCSNEREKKELDSNVCMNDRDLTEGHINVLIELLPIFLKRFISSFIYVLKIIIYGKTSTVIINGLELRRLEKQGIQFSLEV